MELGGFLFRVVDTSPVNATAGNFDDVQRAVMARHTFLKSIALHCSHRDAEKTGRCVVADLPNVIAEVHAHGLWALFCRLSTPVCGRYHDNG